MFKEWSSIIISVCSLIVSVLVQTQVKKIRRWKERQELEAIKIIVVDDDIDDNVFLGSNVLSKFPNEHEYYTSVQEFRNKMPKRPTVYIFDHYISPDSGFDILKLVKEKNKNNYAISYTGAENPSVVSDYLKAQVNAYISKNDPDKYKRLQDAIADGIKKCNS